MPRIPILLLIVLACGSQVSLPATATEPRLELAPPAEGEHPLEPLLRFAKQGLERIDREIGGYRCVLIKRERVEGELKPYQYMRLKVRHARPGDGEAQRLALFARFLGPANIKGREVLYVEGERDDTLLARRGGQRLPNLTLELDPNGRLAMSDNRYPFTEAGIRMLVVRLIEAMEEEIEREGCEVRYFHDAKIDDRPCRHVEVKYPEPHPEAGFHIARVMIDNELRLPVYYAAYGWPEEADGEPVLEEEYVYTQIRLNPDFDDDEFASTNPEYNFQQSQSEREFAAEELTGADQ